MSPRLAEVLLVLSWPVCVVHRYWNNAPTRSVSWIIWDRAVDQDFRWYLVYNELWLSSTLVLIAWGFCRRPSRSMRIITRALCAVSGVDIVNYWLWFRRSETMLFTEGGIMLIATILIFYPCIKARP